MGGRLYQYAGSDLARSLITRPHLQFGTAYYAARFEIEKDKSDNLKRYSHHLATSNDSNPIDAS
jgi:hypothetical protein